MTAPTFLPNDLRDLIHIATHGDSNDLLEAIKDRADRNVRELGHRPSSAFRCGYAAAMFADLARAYERLNKRAEGDF